VITIKSKREFAKMQRAGAAVAAIHDAVREAAVPGASLLDLEAISVRILEGRGCTSSFLGYHGTYPATLCLSPNDVIVHGIPSARRLEEGDILSVDAGAIFEGFHGDAAFTVPIGEVDAAALTLIEVTERALWAGLAVVEKPQVPNHGVRGRGLRLRTGMALCIEPMFNIGTRMTKVDPDGWTVRTEDGSLSAHFEHTVCLTPDGPLIFTAGEEPVAVQFEQSASHG
jgi:methionyl aminopeptidase